MTILVEDHTMKRVLIGTPDGKFIDITDFSPAEQQARINAYTAELQQKRNFDLLGKEMFVQKVEYADFGYQSPSTKMNRKQRLAFAAQHRKRK